MKKIIGIFIVAFISVVVADLLQGVILTLIYTPKIPLTSSLEMANFIQYTIYAITVTIALWGTYQAKSILKSSKSALKKS